jgi:hypothetical protein
VVVITTTSSVDDSEDIFQLLLMHSHVPVMAYLLVQLDRRSKEAMLRVWVSHVCCHVHVHVIVL